jgi:glutamate synthase (NADPH/NADH) large chain
MEFDMSGQSPFERFNTAPAASGLYDPARDRDACGLAMVATLRGTAGHDIIETALSALRNLEHRGAVGSDAGTGDGAGIITQIPDSFFRSVVDFELPNAGSYGAGLVFLEIDADSRSFAASFAKICEARGLELLGVREVPTNPDSLGDLARAAMPQIIQVFVTSTKKVSTEELERELFFARKISERELAAYHP